jgi:hypothetical protein
VDALGGVRLTDDPWERNWILRGSLFRFKGLERLVVGLCELDGAREQALYVGLSRWGSRGRPPLFVPRSAARRIPARGLPALVGVVRSVLDPQEVVLRERVMVDPPLCPEPRPEPLCDPRDSLDS